MICRINNDELFTLSSSLGEEAYLPKLSDNLIKRAGIKMISEDGNNILQGFGAFDIIQGENEITYKIIKVFISPQFTDTNYGDIIIKYLCEYAKELAFGHIILDNRKTFVTSNESEIIFIVDTMSKGHPEALLPKNNKNTVDTVCLYIKDREDIIGFAVLDYFKTAKGLFSRLMNVFVLPEYRNKGIATELLKECKTLFDNSKDKNFFISCVGNDKEILSSILKNLGFIFDGEARGKINYYL